MNRPDLGRLFQEERSYLMGIAYRLLGTVTDAEDALQEAGRAFWRRNRVAS